MKLAQHPGGALPQARLAAQRLEQVARDRSEPRRRRYVALERCYRQPPPVARSHQHLRAPHHATLDRTTKVELYGADRAGLRRRGRGHRPRDRRVPQHRRPRRHEHPGARRAREALREAGRRGAGDRLHDARRRSHGGRQAARRDVLPDRQGARREARRSRRGAGALRDGARSRSGAPADARRRSARSRSTTPTGIAPRATSIRSRATRRRRAQRAKLLVELGKLRDEMLGEHELAVQAYELALQSDADNEDAALPLVDEYIATEQWERGRAARRDARPQERASASAASSTRSRTCSARCCAALGKDDKALKAYQAAHQLDLTDQETIRGLAEVCFRLKDWAGALTNYQKVLTALGEDETEAARRRLLQARLHQARAGPGQAGDQQLREGARARRRAPPDARGAGRHLRRAARTGSRSPRTSARSSTTSSTATSASRCSNEIGDIWSDKEKNPPKAHRGPRGGAAISSRRTTSLLHKLLQLYQATQNWAADGRHPPAIADLETEPERKAQVHLHDGAALSRQAGRPGSRRRALQRGARSEPELPRGLRAHQQDPHRAEGLEAARARVTARCSTASPAKGQHRPRVQPLAQPRPHLSRSPAATRTARIEAFKMAHALKPDEPVERQILAELYEATEQLDEAIGEHAHDPRRRDPLRVDPYRALYKLYLKKHDVRPAWCMCRGARVPAQGRRGGAALLRGLPPAGHDPGEEPARQRAVGEEPLPRGREPLHRQDLRDDHARGARREDRRQLARRRSSCRSSTSASSRIRRPSTVTFAKTFGWAAQVLGIQLPGALRAQRRARRARRRARTSRPRRVAGQTVLTGFTPQELTFIVGKHLALVPRRALHQERSSRRSTELTVAALRRRSRSSQPGARRARRTSAQAVNATAQRAREVHAAGAARGAAPGREEVHRGRREGEHQALDAGGRASRRRAPASCSAATSRSRRRSSPPSRSSRAISRRRRS